MSERVAKAPARRTRSFGLLRRVMFVATVVAVVAPAVFDHDSFPLSTYPMYADRGSRVSTIATAIGVASDGTVRRLSPGVIATTDDPLIAESYVASAIRAGRADTLCQQVVGRAGQSVARVEIVEEDHDVVARARHRESLRKRTVWASCETAR